MSCPLYRGCPLFGGSVIRGFTVLCEELSFLVGTAIARGIHSSMYIEIVKQIGGGVDGCIVLLTRGMRERLTFWLAILSSWWSVWEACSSTVGASVPRILSLVFRVFTAASLLW